ncbi:MAG: PRC-barrel domain-containing protein [Sphaerobacter sp.]|nr:PRC-barrel domain-containing protein [Sphaerobacter sp.]
MDAKQLKGLPVVTIDGGERLGTVNDVLVSTDERAVHALTVHSGGRFGGSTNVVEMAAVRSIGSDAVMVQDHTALQTPEAAHRYRQYVPLGDLSNLRVVNESGSRVGSVSSVRINEETGAITALEVVRVGMTGPFRSNLVVPIDAVRSIGLDAVVVADAASPGGAPEPPAETAAPPEEPPA